MRHCDEYFEQNIELLSNWDMKNFIQDTHFDAYRDMDFNSIRLFSGKR